jgi:hypothetical protein
MRTVDSLTIRLARPEDALALLELAMVDSAPQLEGEILVAEVDGELWAALELGSGKAAADLFRPTAQLVELLRMRAESLAEPRRQRRWKRRPGLYAGPARWSTR